MRYLLVLLLTGCVTTEQIAHLAKQETTPQLCYAAIVKGQVVREAALNEVASRGHNCNDYQNEVRIIHERAMRQEGSNMPLAMELLKRSQGTPAPRTQTNCTSRRVGGSIETHCR